ncbi:zinc finger, CCHC-type containing protein [Tanacetum coccineum]
MITHQAVQGNISLQCPKLTETNYTTWALLMKTILKAHGLWKTIDTKDAIDEKKTHTSKAMIFQTLPEDVLMQVAQCLTTEGRSKRHASEASLVEQEDIKARRLQHKYGGVESVSVALEVAFNEMEED